MRTGQEEILQMATKNYKDLLAPTLIEAPPINLMHHVVACLKTRIGEVVGDKAVNAEARATLCVMKNLRMRESKRDTHRERERGTKNMTIFQ